MTMGEQGTTGADRRATNETDKDRRDASDDPEVTDETERV